MLNLLPPSSYQMVFWILPIFEWRWHLILTILIQLWSYVVLGTNLFPAQFLFFNSLYAKLSCRRSLEEILKLLPGPQLETKRVSHLLVSSLSSLGFAISKIAKVIPLYLSRVDFLASHHMIHYLDRWTVRRSIPQPLTNNILVWHN